MKFLAIRLVSAFAIFVALAGCGTVAVSPTAIDQGSGRSVLKASIPYSGETALAELNAWYMDTTPDCGSATRPAFLCSGVMMRQVETSPNYLSWDPSSSAITLGGISVSWLRADSNFPNLWKPNGFIFYPDYDIPVGKYHPAVLCAFPLDGYTWQRPSQGCGRYLTHPQSRPCDELGITTAAGWIANYYAGGGGVDIHSQECGWNVRQGQPGTASRFYQNVLARAQLQPQHWYYWNELMLATWTTGKGATLPIHSFFFKTGDNVARAHAQSDQQRYHNLYGRGLPIFRLTLPTSIAGRAQFTYDPTDQVVTPTY
ncbi:hypothetical protein [Luteibacter sp.]|jgi:hypothetical protein|uniref:hypothetical protein n=1 Tax=Luteibacter sp. TaxID=1886636 RepID=UPI002F3E41FD